MGQVAAEQGAEGQEIGCLFVYTRTSECAVRRSGDGSLSRRIAERGRRRDPPPALPAGGGIKSAQPRSRRQHDSCFRMTIGKRIESLPVLASFGRRWSVANIFLFFLFFFSPRQWVKVSGGRGGDCRGSDFK